METRNELLRCIAGIISSCFQHPFKKFLEKHAAWTRGGGGLKWSKGNFAYSKQGGRGQKFGLLHAPTIKRCSKNTYGRNNVLIHTAFTCL